MKDIDKTKQTAALLSREERVARLDALADACGRTINESTVYQAAQLFFAVVSSSCFASDATIARTVEEELEKFTQRSSKEEIGTC